MRYLCFLRGVSATLFTLLLFAAPARSTTIDYSQIFIFGDSLSDSGNVSNLTGGSFPPAPAYYNGRFSNGPNWVDRFSASLGLNPVLSTELGPLPPLGPVPPLPTDGINFALGGATSGSTTVAHLATGVPELSTLPGLSQQISTFQALYSGPFAPDPDALFVLWVGGNDYLFNVNDPATVLSNIGTALTTLSGLGAENFLIANLPDLGETPFAEINGGQPVEDALNLVTQAHNTGLEALLASLDIDYSLLDINALFKEALADPAALGFLDPDSPFLLDCIEAMNCPPGVTPDDYVYWDEIHPTSAAHAVIAATALNLIDVPEPSTLFLMSVGLLGLGFAARRRKHTTTVCG
ncbi:SGNH/GDSL hydrolase family protein [Denitrobaculum tricleocarpae]|nr:SGNH/GDSL hydrolase family protein [Denitrobaculum tricleocarpae]